MTVTAVEDSAIGAGMRHMYGEKPGAGESAAEVLVGVAIFADAVREDHDGVSGTRCSVFAVRGGRDIEADGDLAVAFRIAPAHGRGAHLVRCRRGRQDLDL